MSPSNNKQVVSWLSQVAACEFRNQNQKDAHAGASAADNEWKSILSSVYGRSLHPPAPKGVNNASHVHANEIRASADSSTSNAEGQNPFIDQGEKEAEAENPFASPFDSPLDAEQSDSETGSGSGEGKTEATHSQEEEDVASNSSSPVHYPDSDANSNPDFTPTPNSKSEFKSGSTPTNKKVHNPILIQKQEEEDLRSHEVDLTELEGLGLYVPTKLPRKYFDAEIDGVMRDKEEWGKFAERAKEAIRMEQRRKERYRKGKWGLRKMWREKGGMDTRELKEECEDK